ncbi:MAG: preprotein translocase subunit YajC [Ilumatobacter sp.]|nr:preprotein translocase subunit YajC [Ilumatobacter sp.]
MTNILADGILSNAGGSSGSSILSFLFLPLILVAMYFFMIRPQRRRMREQQVLQQSIAVGQEVVTTSGIFGTITGEDGDSRLWLEIDDDVQIRVARAAIQSVIVTDDDNGDTTPADASTSTED